MQADTATASQLSGDTRADEALRAGRRVNPSTSDPKGAGSARPRKGPACFLGRRESSPSESKKVGRASFRGQEDDAYDDDPFDDDLFSDDEDIDPIEARQRERGERLANGFPLDDDDDFDDEVDDELKEQPAAEPFKPGFYYEVLTPLPRCTPLVEPDPMLPSEMRGAKERLGPIVEYRLGRRTWLQYLDLTCVLPRLQTNTFMGVPIVRDEAWIDSLAVVLASGEVHALRQANPAPTSEEAQQVMLRRLPSRS